MLRLAFIFIFPVSLAFGQTGYDVSKIDSVLLYKDFLMGGTTANLYSYSGSLDTNSEAMKVLLSSEDLDSFKLLITSVKSGKHFQQKVGPSYYLDAYLNGQKHKMAVVPDFGIIDLTTKRQFVLRNTKYESQYALFIENVF